MKEADEIFEREINNPANTFEALKVLEMLLLYYPLPRGDSR